MDQSKQKEIVAATGKMLLERKLVARTWGNVSARVDKDSFVITPSGLDYVHMTAEDIATVHIADGTWEGKLKPSGERGIHKEAYRVFEDAGFVIHTHQNNATAIGLAGFDKLDITKDEQERLGGIAISGYGLPGTGKLKKNVATAMESGAKVVLMAHHGALIVGKDREDAFAKAVLLEEICQRNLKVDLGTQGKESNTDLLRSKVREVYQHAEVVKTPAVVCFANKQTKLIAQLDDMAQMIGRTIPVSGNSEEEILHCLSKTDAVIVPNVGAIVKSDDPSDAEALAILVDKACICYLHTDYYKVKARLGWLDDTLMRFVYKKKYSKQK